MVISRVKNVFVNMGLGTSICFNNHIVEAYVHVINWHDQFEPDLSHCFPLTTSTLTVIAEEVPALFQYSHKKILEYSCSFCSLWFPGEELML